MVTFHTKTRWNLQRMIVVQRVEIFCTSLSLSLPSPSLPRVLLPDYVLDFGYVIPGQVLTSVLNVTNSGSVPLSLSANTKCLAGTGTMTHHFLFSTFVMPQCLDHTKTQINANNVFWALRKRHRHICIWAQSHCFVIIWIEQIVEVSSFNSVYTDVSLVSFSHYYYLWKWVDSLTLKIEL